MIPSRSSAPTIVPLIAGLVLSFVVPDGLCGQKRPADQKDFFGLAKTWDIKITISADSLAKMYPEGRVRMGLSQGRGRYKYVEARVVIGDRELPAIGVRFKGNSTFWTTGGTLKKSFKLDFDRFRTKQRFLRLKKLNLHNNATDASQIREAVSYEVYRQAGVPASRTCFARVFLTVEGRLQEEFLGNYTVVEQVDRRFLEWNYGEKAGIILKPEGRVLPFLGDTWNDRYEKAYVPKTSVEVVHSAPLVGLAKLVSQGDDAVLADGIERVLDVSEFLNYCAVTAYLANLDSPFMLGHNFYLAVPDGGKRVVWIPWDLNLSLGGFIMAGRNQEDLSVFEATRLPLFTRLIALPRFRTVYKKHLWALAKGPGSAERLTGYVELAQKTTAAAMAQEADRSDAVTEVQNDRGGFRGFGERSGFSRMFRGTNVATFAKGRSASVVAQLEGKSEGQTVQRGFGRGNPSRSRARARSPRECLRDMLVHSAVLKLAGAPLERGTVVTGVRALFAKIDKDRSGVVSRAELATTLRQQRGQDAVPSEARRIRREVDADKNRQISVGEWEEAYLGAFATWDANGDGKLSESELAKRRG